MLSLPEVSAEVGLPITWADPKELHLEACAGGPSPQPSAERACEPDCGLWLYRHRTLALLRRYCRMAMELGRLPSLLGREFFRTRVTSYRMASFEDVVIFVHDVERCLERLDKFSQALIARLVLQEYTHEETAELLHCTRRTVGRRFPEALDEVTRILLAARLLTPMVSAEARPEAPIRAARDESKGG
jgi:hypothetical protein